MEKKILLPIEKIIDDRLISKKLYRALIPLSGAKILAKIERTNGPCFTNRLIESAFDTIQSQTGIDDELKNEARVSLSSDEYEQILHFLTLIIELLGEQSHNSAEIENLLMHQYMLSENIAVFIRLRYSKYIYDLTNSYKPAPCCNIK